MFNAQSIRNKVDLFRAQIAIEKPDVIGITETWIHTDTRDFVGEYTVQGYKLFKKDRIDKEGGGVMLYIREWLEPIERKIELNQELLEVEMSNLPKKINMFILYRPPHQSAERDNELYSFLKNRIRNKLCILAGDFNCPINWNDGTADLQGRRLLDFANDEFLTQWVDKPTRGNNILDLIFSSEDDLISGVSVGEKLGKSDHNIVRFEIETNFAISKNTYSRLDFRRANFESLRLKIREMQRSSTVDNESRWQYFKTSFMESQDTCVPKKQVTSGGLQKPKWFNNSISEAIGSRQRAYKIYISQASEEARKIHIGKCRIVKKLIRKAKLQDEEKVAALAKTNPKAFFAHVNSTKSIKSSLGPLKNKEGKVVSNDGEMAEMFNEYFVSVFTNENTSNIPTVPIKYEGSNPLSEINITTSKVKEKIGKLDRNKSQGPDNFHPRVLKETQDEVAIHLCEIYQPSLDSSKAVKDWKLQNTAPLFKKGAKDNPANYRPVALTSVPGKILESIIVDEIVNHLETNNLILDSQHGFRKGRSCLTNLIEFFHEMFKIYDHSRAIDILYLDFQKAFDKVPHKRLMRKVRSLGIQGKVADWIEDWLSDRKQRVVINGSSSSWKSVTSGVPQGSVLGPILFIIYINDIDLGLTSKLSKFADDTKMGINANNDEAIANLKSDLKKVEEWSEKWQMPFNVDKCKVMHIGFRNRKIKYELFGGEIESCEREKDLGVVVTSDMKFSRQCIEAEKKAQKLLGYIKRHFISRKKETILTLYRALVRPHLEYAVQFWSPTLRKDIKRLESVQERATKLISDIRGINYNRRLAHLNLFSLETRRLRGQLIETFKIIKGITNLDYRNLFTLSSNRTRSNGWKLDLHRFNTTQCGEFITFRIVTAWNKLPVDVVDSETVTEFKRKLDKIIYTLV